MTISLFVYGPLADTIFLDCLLQDEWIQGGMANPRNEVVLTTAWIRGFACKLNGFYPALVERPSRYLQQTDGFVVNLDEEQMQYVENYAATTFKLRACGVEIETPKSINGCAQRTVVKFVGKVLIWGWGDEYPEVNLADGDMDERQWRDELKPMLMGSIVSMHQRAGVEANVNGVV